jgi:hypothetical protein
LALSQNPLNQITPQNPLEGIGNATEGKDKRLGDEWAVIGGIAGCVAGSEAGPLGCIKGAAIGATTGKAIGTQVQVGQENKDPKECTHGYASTTCNFRHHPTPNNNNNEISPQPQPQPQSSFNNIANSPHCDKPGWPSCNSVGFAAGQQHPGTSCPSGHSVNYCRGWVDAAS